MSIKPKKDCPFMIGDEWHERCGEEVPEGYFERVCMSPAYLDCRRYNAMMKLLDIPFNFWFKKAMKESKKEVNSQQFSVELKEGGNLNDSNGSV